MPLLLLGRTIPQFNKSCELDRSGYVVPQSTTCYTPSVSSKLLLILGAGGVLCSSWLSLIGPTSPLGAAATSTQAKSLTHLLEEHYRQPRTLQAEFLERYSEGRRQVRIESGRVFFRRPGQMRWEYESPEQKLFLVDGKVTWFYVPYDHTVTRAPVKDSSDLRTPLALLTGKPDLERLCSDIDLISENGVPAGHAVLRCVPKESKETLRDTYYTEVLLEVDASAGELARIDIRQPGGIELEYRFGNWQTDIPLASDLFRFQIPAGVAIVDGVALTEPPR